MSMDRAWNLARSFVGQEIERIKGVERELALQELNTPPKATPQIPPAAPAASQAPLSDEQARKLLGVADTASFSEIRTAFERIYSRADPYKFANDPDLKLNAQIIRDRVVAAYRQLSKGQDATDLRFGSLDLS